MDMSSAQPVVAADNVDQARAWDGDEGEHWTKHEEHYDAAIRRYSPHLLRAAAISPDHRVLDIGCGTGQSTRDAARIALMGSAFGVDLSARMVQRARERAAAESLTNVTFAQADAQVHPFDPEVFDIAISRAGALFFGDPADAFANIARALRPGGRLALLAWQRLERNEWVIAIRDALAAGRVLPAPMMGAPGPFGLADPDKVVPMLAAAGFANIGFEAVNEPIYQGANTEDAFGFVCGTGIAKGLLRDLDDAGRTEALQRLRATMAAHATVEGVLFDSNAWLITADRR
jgi:SAM-dependent methyltransferase